MSQRIFGAFRGREKKNVFDKGDPKTLYDLLDCLGEGTYGTVWTGTEKSTGRMCAVKIVKIDDDLDEIKQEIMIMKDSDSPYIVKFFGAYWGEKERIWMVMEHCIAGSINDLMYVCDITLNLDEVKATTAAVAMGLRYLHKNLVIHRDIKAGNVLLTAKGHIRLADFGVSAKLKKPSDRTNTAIGAPFWMAPEVISEQYYDGKADVWSMGITVIELIEGRPPNSHMNAMKALFAIPNQQPPTLKDKKLPQAVHDFVKICLTKNPKKRPNSKQTLQHPFIKEEARNIENNEGRSQIMMKLVKQSLKRIEKWRREQGEDEDSEDESIEGDTEASVSVDQDPDKETIGITDMLPLDGPKQRRKSGAVSEPEVRDYAPPPVTSPVHKRKTHLNPSRDAGYRLSAKDPQHSSQLLPPLRDVAPPNQSNQMLAKGNMGNQSPAEIHDLLSSDLPANSPQVQAAVMTKEFINLLKVLYKSSPESFSHKSPEDWTGVDISRAVVGALTMALDDNPEGKAVEMSENYMHNKQKTQKVEEPEETKDDGELKDLMEFMSPLQEFVVGRDGAFVPPPPPDDDDDDLSDL